VGACLAMGQELNRTLDGVSAARAARRVRADGSAPPSAADAKTVMPDGIGQYRDRRRGAHAHAARGKR
jgi:hypothetical protein